MLFRNRRFIHLRIRSLVEGILTLLCITLMTLLGAGAEAATRERLEYDLYWGLVKVGTAVLSVDDDQDLVRITASAQSSGFISVFYPVEDIIVSTVRKNSPSDTISGGFTPHNYRVRLREGRHRRDKEVIFDTRGGKITFADYLNDERIGFPLNGATRDALSSFFYVRYLPLEVGRPVYVEVFESKRLYTAEVKILRKETVTTALGTQQAFVIRPLVQSEGIFLNKGDIHIWITDDRRRIPVLVKAKVPIGSVTAELRAAIF